MSERRVTISLTESTYKDLVEKQLEISNREKKIQSMDSVIYELIIEHNERMGKPKNKK